MKTIKISVIQDDINKGIKKDCGNCPIARGLASVFPSGYRVNVGPNYLIVWNEGNESVFRCETPEICQRFINDFDHDQEVNPFEFEIDLDCFYDDYAGRIAKLTIIKSQS